MCKIKTFEPVCNFLNFHFHEQNIVNKHLSIFKETNDIGKKYAKLITFVKTMCYTLNNISNQLLTEKVLQKLQTLTGIQGFADRKKRFKYSSITNVFSWGFPVSPKEAQN